MAKVDQKLQMIGTAIILEAQRQRAAMMAAADREKEAELDAYRESLLSSLFDRTQRASAEIRQDTVRRVAQAEQNARRSLLLHREGLTAQVFAAAGDRLLAYADTESYSNRLLEQLGGLADAFDHSTSAVFLRSKDLELSDQIRQLLPGCRVERAGDIAIGGFRLENSGARSLVDRTLDWALEQQRPWFLAACGLEADKVSTEG